MGAGIEPSSDPVSRRGALRNACRWIVSATLLLSACSHVPSDVPPSTVPRPAGAGAPSAAPGAGGTGQLPGAGRTPDAAAAVQPSPSAAGAITAADMARGREARREGRLADAAIAFERVIRADRTAFDARIELVEVLLLQSVDLGRADTLLDEARALRGYDPQVDRLRAWLDELRGDPAAAAADYARVLAVSPDPEIRLRRASLLLRVNRIDDALVEYEKVAAERPGDRATRATLADIYEYRGRLADAERMLSELAQAAPGDLGPVRRLASFYRRTGQLGKAIDVESRLRALESPPRALRPLKPSVR